MPLVIPERPVLLLELLLERGLVPPRVPDPDAHVVQQGRQVYEPVPVPLLAVPVLERLDTFQVVPQELVYLAEAQPLRKIKNFSLLSTNTTTRACPGLGDCVKTSIFGIFFDLNLIFE